jgi:hypothetical protein
VFAYEKAHVEGAVNIPLELLAQRLSELPDHKLIVVYDSTGKKAIRPAHDRGQWTLQCLNVSGGFASLSGYVRALTPANFRLVLPAPEPRKAWRRDSR